MIGRTPRFKKAGGGDRTYSFVEWPATFASTSDTVLPIVIFFA
jgi:hypothetical protein